MICNKANLISVKRYINKGSYLLGLPVVPGGMSDSEHKYNELSPESLKKAITKFREDLENAKQAILDGINPCIPVITTNRKLDNIYTVKTLPVLTCTGICGKCAAGCYAVKLNNMFAGSRANCAHNQAVFELDPQAFFKGIEDYCKTAIEFRWHESGEVVDMAYLDNVIAIARNCPNCEFLLYTKRLNLIRERQYIIRAIKNLHVVASCMDIADLENTKNLGFPRTIVDYSHKGVPAKYKKPFALPDGAQVYNCKSDCELCRANSEGCWNKASEFITVFEAH